MYKNLELARKNKKLTIKDMSKVISKSPATYYKKEMGVVTISVKEAILIAKKLDMDIEYLFIEF